MTSSPTPSSLAAPTASSTASPPKPSDIGSQMHQLCQELYPICRSITGDGMRQSLRILQQHVPQLQIHEVPSGTQCFDWQVPQEWNIRDAYIITPRGEKICQLKEHNLHILGYAIPTRKTVSLEELQKHLYSLPQQPEAIPYVTSYYQKNWGFCISHQQRQQLEPGDYQVVIDSELKDGHLSYGEIILPGHSTEEIFLSSYLCHPSMANNELSGPVVATTIAQWLAQLPQRRYTYRIALIPETIGSITYLSRHHQHLKQQVIAGFNLTCIGDDRAYSYLPSRQGNSLADRAALHVLQHQHPDYIAYTYLDRGSDERQYCSPGINLPLCSLMRSKHGTYPEYHTSLDDLSLVTPSGLAGGYQLVQKTLQCLENNQTLRATTCCEPQLGKRNLYPKVHTNSNIPHIKNMMNFLAYADGTLSNLAIAETIGAPLWELEDTIKTLKKEGLLEEVES